MVSKAKLDQIRKQVRSLAGKRDKVFYTEQTWTDGLLTLRYSFDGPLTNDNDSTKGSNQSKVFTDSITGDSTVLAGKGD